jgi:hypothetical protein
VVNKSNHPIYTPSIVTHTPINFARSSTITFPDRWQLERRRTQILSKVRARDNNVHMNTEVRGQLKYGAICVDEVCNDAEKFLISGTGHPTDDSISINLNA